MFLAHQRSVIWTRFVKSAHIPSSFAIYSTKSFNSLFSSFSVPKLHSPSCSYYASEIWAYSAAFFRSQMQPAEPYAKCITHYENHFLKNTAAHLTPATLTTTYFLHATKRNLTKKKTALDRTTTHLHSILPRDNTRAQSQATPTTTMH